ncbi:Non-specific lipid-transfer protein-like protein [Melia azedarach]|uniref:Non-specific lipid-transfer protein-like protein n=1 Tax=Melia azedarach TaxID=155640 RepID=A0ACC1YV91_MELAZ|nr:Non-specific lipid-transfer protein-like protein [Melia azedarach]
MGNSSNPSSSCCSNLGSVVQQSPQCLCAVLNGGPSLGITINQTLALSLPGACKVQTPPVGQCKAASGPTTSATSPVGSPAISPADSANETPDPGMTPSASVVPSGNGGAGSKTVPTTGGASDGSITRSPSHFVLFVLFITACASTIIKF